jgi:hypothetical protein
MARALAGTTAGGESDGVPLQARSRGTMEKREKHMKIRITIGSKSAIATLADNETSRDLASLLPLTLTLKDFAETEKIGYPPRKLSTKGAPPGHDPVAGDITYYAPWGNLALFYQDGHDSPGLIKLGRIDSGVEVLGQAGALKATFERGKE